MGGLEPRHTGHGKGHYANVPFGYGLVAVSLLYCGLYSICHVFDRKFRRRFGRPLVPRWWVLAMLWIATLCGFLFVHESLVSLNTFAKRAGRVTYAVVPLAVFLSLKPSPLPGISYINLWAIHKWVGRSIAVAGAVHGIAYIVHFAKAGEAYKILHFFNFLGIIILSSILLIVVSSLPWVRRFNYRLFYRVHVVSVWFVVFATLIHARPKTWFLTLFGGMSLCSQIVYTAMTSKRVKIQVLPITRTLYYVSIPRYTMPDYIPVGAHVRLNEAPRMWVETVTRVIEPTHPFTVASLSSDDHIKLVVRASKLPLFDGNYFIVSGPYASQASLDFPNMRSRKTLVIAGGSGISLGAPIARSCLERGEQVRLLWVTRERSDIRLLKLLDIESAVVYITGSSTGSTDYSDTMGSRISKTEADVGGDVFEVDELLHKHDLDDDNYTIGDDSDEEDDTPTSTASDSKTSRASTPPPLDSAAASSGAGPFHNREEGLDIRDGRPVISQESLSFFGSSGGPETLVVACGPVKLVSDAKRWARANSVQFTGDVYQV